MHRRNAEKRTKRLMQGVKKRKRLLNAVSEGQVGAYFRLRISHDSYDNSLKLFFERPETKTLAA